MFSPTTKIKVLHRFGRCMPKSLALPKRDSHVKLFKRGARNYLHPSLSFLDSIDCELLYYQKEKVIVVSYDPSEEKVDYTDYTRKTYAKCVMSGDVEFVVSVMREYINDKKHQARYNAVINSDVQEPIDITGENPA